jgi:hypothetical protein
MVDGEPRLLLQKEDGSAEVASGTRLVEAFVGLRTLPRLVVLISCQSGGNEEPAPGPERAVLTAIGPRLAEAGVAAVLAMQGDLEMSTARVFLPRLFEVLQETGQIDQAVTEGRMAVANDALARDRDPEKTGAWIPVLYTRLTEGRVWFSGRLTGGDDLPWKALIGQLKAGKCVPILGSGLLEPFVGSTREIANRLAASNGYPLALSGREDIPLVSQFLKIMGGDFAMRDNLFEVMSEAVLRRWPDLDLGSVVDGPSDKRLRQLLVEVWKAYQKSNPHEPHRFLARLREVTTIITTNPDDLLEEALIQVGRKPVLHPCSWEKLDDVLEGEPDEGKPVEPTGDRPHVYQLFGNLGDAEQVVVTEDDYFRFLATVNRKRADDLLGDQLRRKLVSSALIFLGFRITDWDFRALIRLLLDQGGRAKRGRFMHVAVQIDPDDGTHTEAVLARRFFERQFNDLVSDNTGGKLAIFWGSTENFIQELAHQWGPTPSNPLISVPAPPVVMSKP